MTVEYFHYNLKRKRKWHLKPTEALPAPNTISGLLISALLFGEALVLIQRMELAFKISFNSSIGNITIAVLENNRMITPNAMLLGCVYKVYFDQVCNFKWPAPSGCHVYLALTHWPLRDVEVIVEMYFSNCFYELKSRALPLKLALVNTEPYMW